MDRQQFIEALILYVVSQGRTVDEARKNLQEALELFFETASCSGNIWLGVPVFPQLDKFTRSAAKEQARNQNVGVDYDWDGFERAHFTASPTLFGVR
ncbi:MAG: type II toxin-antitoxin system HicB family antitoxin, partial [Desulfobacterales bacterium]